MGSKHSTLFMLHLQLDAGLVLQNGNISTINILHIHQTHFTFMSSVVSVRDRR